MRVKKSIISFVVILIPALLIIGAAVALGDGTTITVDDNGDADFASIQEAVDSAEDGDVVFVYPGIYSENIEVYRELSIVSESGPKSTFIISNDPEADVLYVTADNVSIDGFSVLGLLTETGSISENEWPDGLAGIFLNGAGGCEIANNSFVMNDVGIFLLEADNCVLYNNVAALNYWDGIDLLNSSGCLLYDNHVVRNDWGILLDNSTDNTLLNNTVSASSYEGISLLGCTDCFLEGNRVCGNELGIYMNDSENNSLTDNRLKRNNEGIFLEYSENNLIYSNHFDNLVNAEDYGTNVWNGSLGNHWSDYSGEDADKDGIGDTPYIINESTDSIDYMPLMGLFPLSPEAPENNSTNNSS